MTLKAQCTACGGDCSQAYGTYRGAPYHFGCIPAKPSKGKTRSCWNCGADMGWIEDKYYDRTDTCGARECEREAGYLRDAERSEAHERLDRDMGWS